MSSLQNRRHLPSDECWEKGCACRGARGGGVITRLTGEKGMSVVSFFFTQNTQNSIMKQVSHAFDGRWEKGHVLAEGGY